MMEAGKIIYEKVYASLQTSSEDFFERQLNERIGSGKLLGGGQDSNKPNQKNKSPNVVICCNRR